MFNPFKKTYETDEQEMLAYLSELILFSDLTDDERALFLPHLHKRSIKRMKSFFLEMTLHMRYTF